jgi:hypothetical protein
MNLLPVSRRLFVVRDLGFVELINGSFAAKSKLECIAEIPCFNLKLFSFRRS